MRSCPVKAEVSPYVLIYLALAAVIIPLRWLGALLIASAVHEAGHLLMLKLMNVSISKLSIDLSGAKIHIGNMSYGQELLCACAGPVAGALLICCGKYYPELAICAFCQSIYNLLPILPYDGGRVLRCLSVMLFPQNVAQGIQQGAQWLVYAMIIGIGLFMALERLFVLSFILFAGFVLFLVKRKIACKAGLPAVQ